MHENAIKVVMNRNERTSKLLGSILGKISLGAKHTDSFEICN